MCAKWPNKSANKSARTTLACVGVQVHRLGRSARPASGQPIHSGPASGPLALARSARHSFVRRSLPLTVSPRPSPSSWAANVAQGHIEDLRTRLANYPTTLSEDAQALTVLHRAMAKYHREGIAATLRQKQQLLLLQFRLRCKMGVAAALEHVLGVERAVAATAPPPPRATAQGKGGATARQRRARQRAAHMAALPPEMQRQWNAWLDDIRAEEREAARKLEKVAVSAEMAKLRDELADAKAQLLAAAQREEH